MIDERTLPIPSKESVPETIEDFLYRELPDEEGRVHKLQMYPTAEEGLRNNRRSEMLYEIRRLGAGTFGVCAWSSEQTTLTSHCNKDS